jgi:small subunit ribosomal protein S2
MAIIAMKQLLEAGVHFGHQTRRWNPKMKPFIFQERNGIYILDLQQTLKRAIEAYEFVKGTAKDGGSVLFVGTKKQAADSISEEAERCGQHYINQRWLGGLLTNYETISRRINRLHELEAAFAENKFETFKKLEIKRKRTELQKLQKYLGGVRNMSKIPTVMFIVDLRKEYIAFLEAKKLGVKTVALVDTNCDPTGVDYPIPGNDDAIRAVRLISHMIADAVLDGVREAQIGEAAEESAAAKEENEKAQDAEEIDLREKEVFKK